MHIIIAGCGRVGSHAAGALSREGHSVIVIDRNPRSFRRLSKNFVGTTLTGLAFDKEILQKAGIEHADAFVAVTNGDNSNIVSARIAKEVFRVPIVVSRIYDPQRAEIYRRFGVVTFAPTVWGANKVIEMVTSARLGREYAFGNDEIEMLLVWAPGHLIGKPIAALNVPGEIQVAVIIRMGKPVLPVSGTRFEDKDQLHVLVHQSALGKFQKMMGLES
jgi:trk system potassium uptake protein TrkA